MTRRILVVLPLLLASCGKQPELPPNLFPQTAAGVWRRGEVRDLPVSESPDPVPRNEIDRLRQADYEGPGKLQARVYLLRSDGVSLELTQRWRPSADTVFFNVRRYFVVVKWQTADRKSLQQFVHDLEAKLSSAH